MELRCPGVSLELRGPGCEDFELVEAGDLKDLELRGPGESRALEDSEGACFEMEIPLL